MDIKVGKGALLHTKKEAEKLSELMKKIGEFYNREVETIISEMNNPLGTNIGNSLEVLEGLDLLTGKIKKGNFYNICMELSSELIRMAKGVTKEKALEMANTTIKDGSAYRKFQEVVKAQGGDLSKLKVSKKTKQIKSNKKGILKGINAFILGEVSVGLGAGRMDKDDVIDPKVGIILHKQAGDEVKKGSILCTVYYTKSNTFDIDQIREAFSIE